MNHSFSIVRLSSIWALALVTGAGLGGCAASTEPLANEAVTTTAQALGESGCAVATADATFEGGADFATFSRAAVHAPEQYSNPNCYKSVVVDINDFSPDFTNDASIEGGGTGAYWSDFDATDRTTCEGQYVRAILYEFHDGGPGVTGGWFKLSDVTSRGEFHDPAQPGDLNVFPTPCSAPGVLFDQMLAGRRYRIAATARSSGLTRMLTIVSSAGFEVPR